MQFASGQILRKQLNGLDFQSQICGDAAKGLRRARFDQQLIVIAMI